MADMSFEPRMVVLHGLTSAVIFRTCRCGLSSLILLPPPPRSCWELRTASMSATTLAPIGVALAPDFPGPRSSRLLLILLRTFSLPQPMDAARGRFRPEEARFALASSRSSIALLLPRCPQAGRRPMRRDPLR